MNARNNSPLFRAEAVAEQQDRWLGSVLLVPRFRHSLLTAMAVLLVLGLIGLIAFGQYTRKVRLSGWLTPDQGLLQVVAPQAGVLAQIAAQEGLQVEKGQPLAVLSTERRSAVMGATQAEVLRALQSRRASLLAERDSHRALFARQAQTQQARLTVVRAEAASLEAEYALQRERVTLAEAAAERQTTLRARGLSTEQDLIRSQETAFDQALALQELGRTRATLERTQVELDAEIAERPFREQVQLADIDRQLAQIAQDLAQAEAEREAVVTAPAAGTVTALRAAAGDGVVSAAPLMTLIPQGAQLQARLYSPSRDIGFVRPGQRVLLRYDAYPHQKFGQYAGQVISVSRATVGASELSEVATGPLSDLLRGGEPVYRITVALEAQSATAYGRAAPLQAGMTLQADVQIERRALWEWVMDPLHSLRGRGDA